MVRRPGFPGSNKDHNRISQDCDRQPFQYQGVGGGLMEFRIHTSPGYRICFGREAKTVIILLGGGTKARQQPDIATAKANWQDYKNRNRRE